MNTPVVKRIKRSASGNHLNEHYLINLYTLLCRVEGTDFGVDFLECQLEDLRKLVYGAVSTIQKNLGFTYSRYLKGELECNVNQFRKILNLDLSFVHSSFELVDNYIKRIKCFSADEVTDLAGKYFNIPIISKDLDISVGHYLNASVDGFDSLLYFDIVFQNEQGTRWAIQFVPSTKDDDYDTYRNLYIANQVSSDIVQELVLIYPDKNIIKQYVKSDKSKFEYYSSKIVSGESAFRTLPNIRFKSVNDLNAMLLQ